MSQLFTYFVCSLESIEHWADALDNGDEEAQEHAEAKMPLVTTLRNVGETEFNILARCFGEEDFDVVKTVGEIDLVRAISEDDGPWIIVFRRPAIEAVGGMKTIDQSILDRWINKTAAFNGNPQRCADHLTADAADALRILSRRAIDENLPLFACSSG